MNSSVNHDFRLTGTDLASISSLTGEQWSTEGIQDLFQGATWIFRPEGFLRLHEESFNVEAIYTAGALEIRKVETHE